MILWMPDFTGYELSLSAWIAHSAPFQVIFSASVYILNTLIIIQAVAHN